MSCVRCKGSRLDFGGWMGPTEAAPYPRSCPACAADDSPRQLQSAYATYLHGLDEGHHLQRRLRLIAEGHV